MMEWNVLIGVPALILGFMLMWAFRRYALVLRGNVTQHLGAALFWVNVRSSGRSVWWDFFNGFDLGNSSNWIWNLIGLYVSYHAMKTLHMLIPASDRPRYNLFTAVFYPYRMWRRLDDNDHG
tara:strand:- start:745 stop:1110 length:366 start_codon:yes stop_codon:yes gene_type:complete